MSAKNVLRLVLCGAVVVAAGCRKTNDVDKGAFKSAINDYFTAHQDCVWASPIKFPAQADASKENETKGFDALVDAGLLVRSSAEKKRFLIGSKQVTNYDLSDKGHSSWTAEQTEPGYGNFCYGHREVTNIDGFGPTEEGSTARYTVNFHYDVANVAGWASTTEMKSAFPALAADLSGQQTATATLVKNSNGWQVSGMPSTGTVPLPQ
jgi:hypothetical protein